MLIGLLAYFFSVQGNLESKYTFPQAVKKAFEIDNLFVAGINKLNEPEGPDIDFDFVPTEDGLIVKNPPLVKMEAEGMALYEQTDDTENE